MSENFKSEIVSEVPNVPPLVAYIAELRLIILTVAGNGGIQKRKKRMNKLASNIVELKAEDTRILLRNLYQELILSFYKILIEKSESCVEFEILLSYFCEIFNIKFCIEEGEYYYWLEGLNDFDNSNGVLVYNIFFSLLESAQKVGFDLERVLEDLKGESRQ